MREHFRGYYPLTDDEMKHLWESAVFTFDANVLLNFYRYTPRTRDPFFVILENLNDRIWLSYQSVAEFFRNRPTVILAEHEAYRNIEKHLNDLLGTIQQHHKPTSIDLDRVNQIVSKAAEDVKGVLEEARKSLPDYKGDDPILRRLENVFNGKMGEPSTDEEHKKQIEEAKKRVIAQTPPGYKDVVKEGDRAYGDVILWFQLLNHAKRKSSPLLFVTSDVKDDWWLRVKGKTLGPRPELRQEMAKCVGLDFYMYTPDRFLEYAQRFLGLEAQPEAIAEVRSLSAQGESQLSSPLLLFSLHLDFESNILFIAIYNRSQVPLYLENIALQLDSPETPTRTLRFSQQKVTLLPGTNTCLPIAWYRGGSLMLQIEDGTVSLAFRGTVRSKSEVLIDPLLWQLPDTTEEWTEEPPRLPSAQWVDDEGNHWGA